MYTVHSSFTVNPNFTHAGIWSYKYHIKQNIEDLFDQNIFTLIQLSSRSVINCIVYALVYFNV